MKRAFPNSTVLCLDLPGVGTENKRISPLSVSAIADDLRERWRRDFSKNKVGSWICVAHSLGGMITLDWQNRYAHDFSGAVLLNTSSRGVSGIFERSQPQALLSFLKIAASLSVRERERLVLELVSNLKSNDEKILDEWVNYAQARPMHWRTPLHQVIAAAAFRVRTPANIPLLFLRSEKDRLAKPDCSVKLQELLGGKGVAHPKSGHDLTLDDPNWVVEHLQVFANALSVNSDR